MIIPILILGIWAICSILSYGITFAYYQGKWPSLSKGDCEHDRLFAFTVSILGPLSLFTQLLHCGTKYGLKFANSEQDVTED